MHVCLKNTISLKFLKNTINHNTIFIMSKKNEINIAFAGGGTGGHIYPGLAVADSLRVLCEKNGRAVHIFWIGNASDLDKTIVEKSVGENGVKSADAFYGIPSGKLRRYFSFKNFLDIFKIIAGVCASFFILLKEKPSLLFSKGGFVSVPPCFAARLLRIPVFTHECDFTPGLATKINSKSAKKVFVSYKETAKFLSPKLHIEFTGNPVRPAFYSARADRGRAFLSVENTGEGKDARKPILLVLGGSLGARQINELVRENLSWLCRNFIVIHQTGEKNADDNAYYGDDAEILAHYKPFPFIYAEMPDVIAAADVVLSRAGANSLWECATLSKPLVLIPLCGAGTRGDQEDNAEYFKNANAAFVLARENATGEKLIECLKTLLDEQIRLRLSKNIAALCGSVRPAEKIANVIYEEVSK